MWLCQFLAIVFLAMFIISRYYYCDVGRENLITLSGIKNFFNSKEYRVYSSEDYFSMTKIKKRNDIYINICEIGIW